MASSGRSLWLLLVPVFAASACIIGLLVFVVGLSFSRMEDGAIAGPAGLANYIELFSDPGLWRALANTLVFGSITLAVSFAFGLPLAWIAERTNLPGRSLIWTAMLSSLVLPGFLTGMGWLFLAHPRIGLINVVLMDLLHLPVAPFPVTNVAGMGVVQGLALASLTFVLVAPSLRAMDPSFEEAARMSGARFFSLLTRITLPLLSPALLAAAIYIGIIAIGAFDIPAVIGLSNRVYTFSTFMFVRAYPVNGFPDYGTMAAGGAIMIVLALGLSAAYSTVLRRARDFQVITGKGYRPRLVELGPWTAPVAVFVLGYVFVALVLPLVMTVLNSLLPYALPLSAESLQRASFENYRHIPWDPFLRGALHTLQIVLVVPLSVILLSVAFSWIVLRTKLRFRLWLDAIAFLPHAVPGVLFGIGASLVALFVLQKIVPIYGTIALVIVVYTIGWLSFGTRMVNASLIQIDTELVEAGATSGAGPAAIVTRIIAPLLRPALIGLWIYLALLAMRELTLAAFITTPQNLTLPMLTWQLWQNGSLTQAAALATIIVAALLPLLLLYFALGRRPNTLFQ